jgi:uncharacterized protein YecT (DUF1311 family)
MIFFCCIGTGYCQSISDLDKLKSKEQTCLDRGVNMLGCNVQYLTELDSMLNLAYRALRLRLNELEKETLKKDEKKWLRERDAYFKKLREGFQRKFDEGDGGEVEQLEWYVGEEIFIEERVTSLIERRTALEKEK